MTRGQLVENKTISKSSVQGDGYIDVDLDSTKSVDMKWIKK